MSHQDHLNAIARKHEHVLWLTPFYKAVTHGLYVALDDECLRPNGDLTHKGLEFVQKKKVKALILCHRHRGIANVPNVAIIQRPITDLHLWLRTGLRTDVARRYSSIGVLVDAADSYSILVLTLLEAYMHKTPISVALRAACAAIGGGGIHNDQNSLDFLADCIRDVDHGNFVEDAEDHVYTPAATDAALRFFAEKAAATQVFIS